MENQTTGLDERQVEADPEPVPQKNPQPVCPYCGADPVKFTLSPLHFGPVEAGVIYCGNPDCRKVLGLAIAPAPQRPLIVPNGPLPADLTSLRAPRR
jgi:hypothetical protein